KLVPIVSSARAARVLCQKWYNGYNYLPDAIVVEGPKAGGHLGYSEVQINDEHYSLEQILPQVVEVAREFGEKYNREIPVIAAGGIYTGDDIFRMMELGASGVQLGTLFVTTTECDASEAFKQKYIDSHSEDIEIIKSPVGMPGRAIFSKFIEDVRNGVKRPKHCPYHCIKTCDISKSPYCIMLALFSAFKGNFNKGYAFAGVNAFRAERISTVKETISALMVDYKAKLIEKAERLKLLALSEKALM
ncbi:MAG: nitronate monooxygenase, partial [Mucinivorans sp.]